MGRLLASTLVLVALMLPAASFGQPLSPSPLDPEWRLVAEADWIVRARLVVPKEELERAIRTGKGDHVRVKLNVVDIIKGTNRAGPVECVYWSGEDDYTPSPKAVIALDSQEALVFALKWEGRNGYILHDKMAIRPFEPGKAERLRREVLNQRTIAKNFARLAAARPDEFESTVRGLIGKMLVKETQQTAVYKLQRLDPRAAPSIIRQMDDRRPLPFQQHTQFLNTAPNAFEGIVHYSPRVVVEALASVLPELTRESFGQQISNGGTEEERRKAVESWRIYLHYRLVSEARPKGRTQPPVPTKQSPTRGPKS